MSKVMPAEIEWIERGDEDYEIPEHEPLLLWAPHYGSVQYGFVDIDNLEFYDFTHFARVPSPEDVLVEIDPATDKEFAALPDVTRVTEGVARPLRECV